MQTSRAAARASKGTPIGRRKMHHGNTLGWQKRGRWGGNVLVFQRKIKYDVYVCNALKLTCTTVINSKILSGWYPGPSLKRGGRRGGRPRGNERGVVLWLSWGIDAPVLQRVLDLKM